MQAREPTARSSIAAQARPLARWTFYTHAIALAGLAYELATSALPLLIGLALTVAVIVAGTALLLTHPAKASRAADIYFWSYGALALLFACAAGAAVAVLALASAPDAPPSVAKLTVPGLVALAMFDLYQAVEATRVRENRIQERLAVDAPARTALIVMLLTSAVASIAASISLVLASEASLGDAMFVAGMVIVLALAVAAAHLALELRQRLAGSPIDDAMRLRLLVALDKAAMQTGAIREIGGVEAQYLGPAEVRILLVADFKDGVSAQHIGPVLEKLRLAASAEVSEVVDVVLASTLPHAVRMT